MIITTSWSLAKYVCPSWSSIKDESALRSTLASLDDSGSSLHWWLGFWTFLVVIGVVTEVIFVVWEYAEELHDFKRGIVLPPDKPNTTLFFLGLLGAGLVAAGVSGELWKESQIATLETCVRKGNDALSLLLSKEAGNAENSAETARDEADAATKSSKEAQSKANIANTLSVQANNSAAAVSTKAATLDTQLSEARAKLDDAEKKREELETSLKNLATCTAPRVIPVWSIGTKTGGLRYNDPLLPYTDWSVLIEYAPNDAETQRAATSLSKAFAFARWHVSLKPSERPLADGVEVQAWEPDFMHTTGMPDIGSARDARETAGVVVKFLHSYDWQATLGWMEQDDVTRKLVPPKGILIEIGLYPPVWYVAPPAMKDWSAVMAEQKKEKTEKEQKALKAQKESDDKILSQQLPQMVEIFRRDFEEGRAQQERLRKESEELHANPCQPLETIDPYN